MARQYDLVIIGTREVTFWIGAKDLCASVAAEVVVSAVMAEPNRLFSADLQSNKGAAACRTEDGLHTSRLGLAFDRGSEQPHDARTGPKIARSTCKASSIVSCHQDLPASVLARADYLRSHVRLPLLHGHLLAS